jgi:hypothetical protein
MVAAGMIASVFCLGMIPVKADAVVSEDDFLVRTTGDLADLCKVTTSDPLYTAAINFCHGFSVGVYRVLEEQNRATSRHMFCIPIPALQRAAAITNFVQWVDANPDQKQQAPADGIATYLLRQFPCAAGK